MCARAARPALVVALAIAFAPLAPGGGAVAQQQSKPSATSTAAAARSTQAKASTAAGKRKRAAAARPVRLTARQRTENEIRAAASRVRAALVIQDTATLARLWANEYAFTSLSGELYNKAERLESVMSPSFVVDEAAEVLPSESDVIHLYGNVAVVNSRLGPPGSARSGSRGGRTRLLTVWIRQGGKWLTVASQATGVTGSMPSARKR